ncbi:hypothetical protein [Streptomyces sp. NPDC058623]|uniref:hypothetical protein n=1 Tax=Streptomyces sp. NPDC058623 TaxID=3346563 RepID=UPI00365F1FD2
MGVLRAARVTPEAAGPGAQADGEPLGALPVSAERVRAAPRLLAQMIATVVGGDG